MTQVVHLELNTSDTDAAREFYENVFGWTYTDMPMPNGVYTMVGDAKGMFGGIQQNPMAEAPPNWLAYIGVESIADTVVKVKEAGGTVVMEQPVPGNGSLAVFIDPQGAWIAAWEPENKPEPEPEPKPAKKKAAKKKAAKKKTAKKAAKKTAKKTAKKNTAKKAAKKKTAKKAAKKKSTKKKASKKKAAKKK